VQVSGRGTSTKKARTLVILNISPVTPSIHSLQGMSFPNPSAYLPLLDSVEYLPSVPFILLEIGVV
jgi:hypothetical protein